MLRYIKKILEFIYGDRIKISIIDHRYPRPIEGYPHQHDDSMILPSLENLEGEERNLYHEIIRFKHYSRNQMEMGPWTTKQEEKIRELVSLYKKRKNIK